MEQRRQRVLLRALIVVLAVAAGGCVPCRTNAECPDDTFCALDGQCRDVDPLGVRWNPDAGGGSGGFNSSSSGSPGVVLIPPGLTLSAGDELFINAFPVTDGVVVVLALEIRKVTRTGVLLQSVPLPRAALSAVTSEDGLVVADGALATVYSNELVALRTITLVEGCAAMVTFSNHELVCGPANDWDRVFTVYDLVSGAVRSRSRPETYNGIPMRAVPGEDAFVTVSDDSSPSDFHLYRRNADGGVGYVAESPYHGGFAVSHRYAFHGNPATHVITEGGLLLRIDGPDCGPNRDGCFERDGALGTLPPSEVYLALDTDGAGLLYAVRGGGWWGAQCEQGCAVEQISVDRREVLHSRTYAFEGAFFPRQAILKPDAVSGKVLMGYAVGADVAWEGGGHRLALVDYQ